MVKWSVLTLGEFYEIALFTGLFLSLFIKLNYKRTAVLGGASLLFAIVAAFILNAGIIFDNSSKLFEGILSSLMVVSSVALISGLFLINKKFVSSGKNNTRTILSSILSFLLALVMLPKIIEFIKVIERLVFQSNMFNTNILSGGLGVFLGLLLSIILMFAVITNSKRTTPSILLIYFSVLIVPSIVKYYTLALQAFMLDGIIPMNLSILIPLINSQTILKYVTLALGLLFIPIVIFGKNKHLIPADVSSPAEQRKHKTHLKKEIRWIVVFTLIIAAIYSLQGLEAYQEREEQVNVAAAKPVSAKNGKVIIPLKDISGKELKRFSYGGKENKVTFLAISKGSGVYGVALDACQICGPAGFYQDKDTVICIKCQSVVNKSTLGFPGGCNPIPLEHKIENGKLIIDEKVLLQNEKIFKK